MTTYSLRGRLVIVMLAALAAVLSVVAILLYLGVSRAAWQQHDDSLLARARALSMLAEHDEDGYEFEAAALDGTYLELWLPNGDVIRRGPALATTGIRRSSIDSAARADFFDIELPDGRGGRAVRLRFKPRDEVGNAEQLTLVLAEGVANVQSSIAAIQNLIELVSLVALLVIGGVVWWVTGNSLRPLEQLGRSIERIDDKHLGHRLSPDNQPAELVPPVNKLNDLLARLERSFARERQFTADVSHELRTPLAGLRTLLEVTALAERDTVEYQRALSDAHAIVLQLGALVENLLMLARLDTGELPITTSDVNMRELVDECWRAHAPVAESRSLTFRNQLPDQVLAIDREKLRIVLGNLLANAAEYTDRGGWIEVGSDGALIAVADSGPALADTIKIFDRLWRGDTSRTGTGLHCGIGLALAQSLAAQMSLTLTAENRPDGSVRFALRSVIASA